MLDQHIMRTARVRSWNKFQRCDVQTTKTKVLIFKKPRASGGLGMAVLQ